MGKPANIKTKETGANVAEFIAAVPGDQKRSDSRLLVKMMEKASGQKARMWGPSIIGFGNKRYKSASGREVDWFIIGFSPRKASLSLYLNTDLRSNLPGLEKLGKYKTGGGCLYISKLEDVDLKVLEKMINSAAKK